MLSEPTHLRMAGQRDVPELLAMLHELHAESPLHRARRVDPAKARRLTEHLVAQRAVVLAERGGRALGMAAVTVSEHPWLEGLDAVERVFYVRPQYRGGRVAHMLLEALLHAAREAGAALTMGNGTGLASGFVRALERRGGHVAVTSVVLPLEGQNVYGPLVGDPAEAVP